MFFEQPESVPQLLLLNQLLTVVGDLVPHAIRSVLARAITATFEQPVVLWIAEYINAKTAHKLTFGPCEFGHSISFSCL